MGHNTTNEIIGVADSPTTGQVTFGNFQQGIPLTEANFRSPAKGGTSKFESKTKDKFYGLIELVMAFSFSGGKWFKRLMLWSDSQGNYYSPHTLTDADWTLLLNHAAEDNVNIDIYDPKVIEPEIVTQPESQNLTIGDELSVTATAIVNNAATWVVAKDTVEVANGKGNKARFTKSDITAEDAGSYVCTFTNDIGSVDTEAAIISVS
ncbi:hypothetical protein [Vibrio harveyi]|uniref:hypothetical protein n=1 Tax=Vibrio harveyi TaxID=669 RepID=UPI003D750642